MCEDNSKLEDLLEEKANEMAGKVFILSSPKQVRTAALYTELKLDLEAGTMVGKYTGQEVLSPHMRLSWPCWSSANPCQPLSPSTGTWQSRRPLHGALQQKLLFIGNIVCYLMLSFPLRVKLGGSQEGVDVHDH